MTIDLTFSLQDAYNRAGSKQFEGIDTVLATAVTNAAALYADFGAVSDLGVSKEIYKSETLVFGAAQPGANLDVGGTIRCRLNDGTVYALKIPGIKASLVNTDGTIDISAAAITDYIANFEAAGNYRVADGQYVVSILGGELDR